MLIINKSLNLSLFIVFYFSTKYLIMLGKVADQGPHTNCTSHSLTFPPPIDLQPSFWASVNNRESPSLDNPHILFASITVARSFIRFTRGETTTTIMSSSSTHCVANKRQSLIDKWFAKSCRQIYELIGLRYKICRIASLWYLFYSQYNYKFLAHPIKSLTDRENLLRSSSGYVLQKSVKGLWLVNVMSPVFRRGPWGRNECVTNEPHREARCSYC